MTKICRFNYKKMKEAEAKIKSACPDIDEQSGIYIFTRTDENGIKYAYIGQAINLLQRCTGHLDGYQHIDLSIKKRGFYDANKAPFAWVLEVECWCDKDDLDRQEHDAIRHYAKLGYQLLNETDGGQGEGKKRLKDYGIGGYQKGKKEGTEKALKEIGTVIEKYTTGLISKGGAIADRKTAELVDKLRSGATPPPVAQAKQCSDTK